MRDYLQVYCSLFCIYRNYLAYMRNHYYREFHHCSNGGKLENILSLPFKDI